MTVDVWGGCAGSLNIFCYLLLIGRATDRAVGDSRLLWWFPPDWEKLPIGLAVLGQMYAALSVIVCL